LASLVGHQLDEDDVFNMFVSNVIDVVDDVVQQLDEERSSSSCCVAHQRHTCVSITSCAFGAFLFCKNKTQLCFFETQLCFCFSQTKTPERLRRNDGNVAVVFNAEIPP
jgi:hypothetical protein